MKFKQPPLQIDCEGLSKKNIAELADKLRLFFGDVTILGDEIFAEAPVSNYHYAEAWRIIDHYGVKAA